MNRIFFLTLLLLAGCERKDAEEELDRMALQQKTAEEKVIADLGNTDP